MISNTNIIFFSDKVFTKIYNTELIQRLNLKSLKNKDIDTALSLTIDELLESGYLMDTDSGIIITTSSHDMDDADKLVTDLEDVAKEELEDVNPDITIQGEAVGAKRVEEARILGVTPGKLNLVEKLMESAGVSGNSISGNSISGNSLSDNSISGNIIMSEWLNRSVKDILAETNRYREQNREEEQSNKLEQKEEMKQNRETEQNMETEQNTETEQISGNELQNQENNSNKEQNANSEKNKNAVSDNQTDTTVSDNQNGNQKQSNDNKKTEPYNSNSDKSNTGKGNK